MMKKFFLNLWIPVFLIIVSLPLILPYFHAGYFPTHDGEWAVVRLGDMFREIRDHQFPPRYSENLNFGYGYPLFNFAYPLPYYVGLIVHAFKFSFVSSIKFLFGFCTVLSMLFMYFASKEFWKSTWAGVVSALLFGYLPYRLVDLYARGSIGETFAFVFFPVLFLVVTKIIRQPKAYGYVGLGAIAVAGLILSHNIMALLFFPLLLLFCLFFAGKNTKVVVPLLTMFVIGLCLSAFFWLPALTEKKLILLAKIPIADRTINFVRPEQLLFSPWGYGIPEAATGGFTYQIGWPQIAAFLLAIVAVLLSFKKNNTPQQKIYARVTIFLLASSVGLVLLMFHFTNPIWEHTPLLKEINYPWTLLGPLGFIVSFLAGYVFTLQQKMFSLILSVSCVLAVILYLPWAHPQTYTYYDNSYYLTNDATTTSSSEYTPLWVKTRPTQRPAEKVHVLFGNGTVGNVSSSSTYTLFNISGNTESIVRINTIYYPGWNISIDGTSVAPKYKNQFGVMDVFVPEGNHTVRATFSETPLRLAADMISLINFAAVLILFGYVIINNRLRSNVQ